MHQYDETPIRVQLTWNDWQGATVRFADLDDPHWHQPADAPHAFIHGYVSCATLLDGGLRHHCPPGASSHRLLVCVLKKHTLPAVYAELTHRADARRSRPSPTTLRPAARVRNTRPVVS